MWQRFYDVRKKTRVKSTQFQLQDLRAKAGTDEAGDMRAAQRQLGHKSLAMTETYVRERKGDKSGTFSERELGANPRQT
ncbi:MULTISPECIES: hypothetical protein [unclassified Herbaspirillum]|uniref:hypothetical protein n=1 Tax=unclassified Herbaspirillum TaxID=2624150 RepID=UPI001F1B88C6|nr:MULTISPECIES: hypothetical protein [unclassified Herbaspirillum]